MNRYPERFCRMNHDHTPHEYVLAGDVNRLSSLHWCPGWSKPNLHVTPSFEPPVKTILDDAAKIVDNGERELEYGTPKESSERISKLWSAYLGNEISPLDVAAMMVLLKVARGMDKRDTLVDIAGYARWAERLNDNGA